MKKHFISPLMRPGHPEDAMAANAHIANVVELWKGRRWIEIKRGHLNDDTVVPKGKRMVVTMEKV